jgi:hypothetical protein
MAEQRPKPRKPETESKEETSTKSDTVNLSPEELKGISGGAGHGQAPSKPPLVGEFPLQ